jgi:hypothetical protein
VSDHASHDVCLDEYVLFRFLGHDMSLFLLDLTFLLVGKMMVLSEN